MEIPTGKPQPPPSPGGVCFLWRQLQKEKQAILFWFLMMIAFGFSGSWQDAGMPEGTGMKVCEVSQVKQQVTKGAQDAEDPKL